MVQLRDDVVGLDAAILMAPKVWEASGHVATFTDPLVDCRNCKERFRADHLPDVGRVPELRRQGQLHRGPQLQPDVQDLRRPGRGRRRRSRTCGPRPRRASSSTSRTCRRPTRKKPPFGIAQIGKSFRNEITPGNFIFRTREFEQMEMEFFVPPDDARQLVRVLGARSATTGTSTSASPSRSCASARTTPTSSRTTRPARPTSSSTVPVGLGRARGHREPHRLRPHAAREVLGRGPHLLRPGERPALPAVRDRAGGRAPTARRSRSCSPRTTRKRRRPPTARSRSARCCASTRASRRSRSRCCRCRRTRSSCPLADEVARRSGRTS